MKFSTKFIVLLVACSLCLTHGADEDRGESVEPEGVEQPEVVNKKEQYVRPTPQGDHHFVETFESNVIGSKWIKSKAKKEGVDEVLAKYDGEWVVESSLDAVLEGDLGLVLKSKAKHHAISSKLNKPFKFSNKKPLIIQ